MFMKKLFFTFSFVMPILFGIILLSSCSKDDDDRSFNMILGTWHYWHYAEFNLDGSIIQEFPITGYSYFTFKNENYKDDPSKYLCISDDVYTNETYSYQWYWTYKDNYIYGTAVNGEIFNIDQYEMILKKKFDNGTGYSLNYFKKAIEPEHNFKSGGINPGGGDNPGGGGSSSGDEPYIYNFNYTATKNSITVKFMSSQRPKSATIYYGESSATKSLTTDISAYQLSATAKGLKSGTKYYFKCKVKTDNGTVTSEEYPAMTLY